MATSGRTSSVLLIIIVATSLTLCPVVAVDTQKPSTPDFTVKFIDSSYDTPASSSIDPYTGQAIISSAEHVDNRTIEVKVKNQPFTPYVDDESSFAIKLYYNINVRGHFDGNWTEVFSVGNPHPVQSDSDYTTISLPLGGNVGPFASPANSSSQIDFQVKAMIGYFSRTSGFASWYFAGEESGWSSTQTLTIPPVSQTSPTASPTQTDSGNPPQSSLDWVQAATLVLLSAIAALLVLVVVYLRRRTAVSQR